MTPYYPSQCTNEIPAHSCAPCGEREFGSIRSAGFIHKDFEFPDGDTGNKTAWADGIANKQILLIPETNGEMKEPKEIIDKGYADTINQLLGYIFTATFNDLNFASNCVFYNALIGNRNYKFFFRTETKTYITDVPVTIIPKFGVVNDLNTEVNWNVMVKWIAYSFPCPFDTPEGVFECE